ncbi:hypothetical protein L249_1337 [Ophiocordyceps polyrhachis-furcata BCC 54312]|uniref:AmmeMemoRadiSam system protein B n=1 Tax=Ophiocordyceps polyrhachis-furcata BCC 54312 TaxID=1330021 RepID=A0A367LCV0_9HYPO|nr:hypothetical protein L249_1337 [Ophiocordyceps polyrhachis-furcata BCC 54312]
MGGTRPAAKAGSWYIGDEKQLNAQLESFFSRVPDAVDELPLPISGARIVIAPHAGYDYSGKCAAWAYSCLDLTKSKRVFLLGPSHTLALSGCAVSTFDKYATPFGDFTVDRQTVERIKEKGEMQDMPQRNEIREHSLEMHLPLLYKSCQRALGSAEKFPTIVPIIVGDNDLEEEQDVGKVLLPYLKEEENAFVVSSDFCHWGPNYSYTVYSADASLSKLTTLRPHDAAPVGPPIHESIGWLDKSAMDAVESGKHEAFVSNLKRTRNTVCGRHPIGVAMAGLELLAKEADDGNRHRFRVVRYERSSEVTEPDDMSVSYVSAYAVL